jgi:Bacterial PH domain
MADERTLYEFTISGGNYYDGARNTITQSNCTLTNQRLIIRDSRGRTQQINLRNITSVNPRIGLVNKDLELKMGTTSTLVIYGKKDQLLDIAHKINEAMATPS